MAALPGRGSLSRTIEHSFGRSRIGAATLALAAMFGSAALAMSANGSPPPSLVISAFTAEVSDEGAVEARVVLVNNSSERIEGFAGWLLSVPGGGSWASRSYRSSGQPLDLRVGESVTVEWSENAPIPSGGYSIAAWAHVATPDGPIHSDGRPLSGYAAQIIGRSDLLRIEPPHRNLSITAVDPAESSPSELAVTVYLENERKR